MYDIKTAIVIMTNVWY